MGWMVMSVFDLANAFLPVTPWSLPVLLTFLAIAAIVYARALPKRLEQRRVPALEAVRAMVMAKSLIATGALLAGGHVIYVGRWLASMAAAVPAPTTPDTATGSTVLTRRLPTSSTSAPVRAMRSPRRREARWSLREAARAS